MVNNEFAQIMSLHAGEAYAMQNLTKTDRLGLLISGKVRNFAFQKCMFMFD
jgi:blood vessel epicardial substance